MESYEGELKALPVAQLAELLERVAPRRPSFIFLCARQSLAAGKVFVRAGVPSVVCQRGYLPEEATSLFVHQFYRALLTGAPPRKAFVEAQQHLRMYGGHGVGFHSTTTASCCSRATRAPRNRGAARRRDA